MPVAGLEERNGRLQAVNSAARVARRLCMHRLKASVCCSTCFVGHIHLESVYAHQMSVMPISHSQPCNHFSIAVLTLHKMVSAKASAEAS